LILKSLEEEGGGKDICLRFFPPMLKNGEDSNKKYNDLKEEYLKLKNKLCSQTISGGMI